MPSWEPFYPIIYSIFAFNERDIWFDAGIHWNGISFKEVPFNIEWSGYVNQLWGSSSSDLYVVGDSGSIAHWDGVRGRKIESGTKVNLEDVEKAGDKIFISGYNDINIARSILLEYKDNQIKNKWESHNLIYVEPYGTTITAIAGVKDYLYVSSTKGFFRENVRLNTYPRKVTNMNFDWVYECEANDVNDVFTFSDEPEIYHYNGVDLKPIYRGPRMKLFYGGAVKGDIVVGVGTYYVDIFTSYAFLVVGKRTK